MGACKKDKVKSSYRQRLCLTVASIELDRQLDKLRCNGEMDLGSEKILQSAIDIIEEQKKTLESIYIKEEIPF